MINRIQCRMNTPYASQCKKPYVSNVNSRNVSDVSFKGFHNMKFVNIGEEASKSVLKMVEKLAEARSTIFSLTPKNLVRESSLSQPNGVTIILDGHGTTIEKVLKNKAAFFACDCRNEPVIRFNYITPDKTHHQVMVITENLKDYHNAPVFKIGDIIRHDINGLDKNIDDYNPSDFKMIQDGIEELLNSDIIKI